MRVVGDARNELFIVLVRAKVQLKSFQARGSMKDGERDFQTFPDCSLLSETLSYISIFHEQTFFCQGVFCNKGQYTQCHLLRRSRCH
jgi:hypothetical protein